MFRRTTTDETFLPADETISGFWRRHPETADGYHPVNQTAERRHAETGDIQMRTLSFMLAFVFVLAGPSIAGSSDGALPGIGTFAYTGSSIASSPPKRIMVAAAERD